MTTLAATDSRPLTPDFPSPPAVAPPSQIQTTGRTPNSHAVILTIAALLAAATAVECGGSIVRPASLVYGIILWGWWGGLACVLWKLAPRLPAVTNLTAKAVLIHLAIGSALSLTHLYLLWVIGFPLGWGPADAAFMWKVLFNINRFGIEILLYALIIGVTGIVQYRLRAQNDAIHSLELQRQLSSAHLRALQMQLEPHFLFNTLNAITTLVELDRRPEAVDMLARLNAILKTTLQRSTPQKVPLAEELDMIDNYLAIEQARFPDRLQVEIRIDPSALDGLVPCFLLQPIVENAIRHGIAPSIREGVIEASARRDGSNLHLNIRDTGAGNSTSNATTIAPHNGHGIGLRNTRERLAHFYPDAFAMHAAPLPEGGFEVAITIPYESRPR